MHFNIYLDKSTGARLDEYVRATGTTRNALIRTAIDEWLARREGFWSNEIMEFQGVADFPPFEAARGDFLPPPNDPFA